MAADNLTLTMAFAMGLTGSLHCAGMCGPIMWVLPFRMLHGFRKAAALLLYHTARISVYAGMAALLHIFGHLFHPRWQQYISIGIGCLLLVAGIMSFLPSRRLFLQLPWTNGIRNYMGRFLAAPGLRSMTLAGACNGLLPCGLIYIALAAAVSSGGGAAHPALLMYAFGAGTLPVLIGLTLFRERLRFLQAPSLRKFVPVTVLAMGLLFLLRGLNLGIPYLSPEIEIKGTRIESSCCHRPE